MLRRYRRRYRRKFSRRFKRRVFRRKRLYKRRSVRRLRYRVKPAGVPYGFRYGLPYWRLLRGQKLKRMLKGESGYFNRLRSHITGLPGSIGSIASMLAAHGLRNFYSYLNTQAYARMPWLQPHWRNAQSALVLPNGNVVPYSRELAGLYPMAQRVFRIPRSAHHFTHRKGNLPVAGDLKGLRLAAARAQYPRVFSTVGNKYRDRHGHLRIVGVPEA